MRKVRSWFGAPVVALLTTAVLSGCVGPADTGDSPTTLAPLIQTSFATLAPPVSTTTTAVSALAESSAAPSVAPATATPPGDGASSAGTDATSTPGTSGDSGASSAAGGAYTVVANDTVYGIARRHGISSETLADLNGWSDGVDHPIYPGDDIKVPDAPSTGSTASTDSAAASTTASDDGVTTSTATSSSNGISAGPGGTYVVAAGDYLAGIATKNATTVAAIVAVNGWTDGDKHLIVAGQSIKLPAKGA